MTTHKTGFRFSKIITALFAALALCLTAAVSACSSDSDKETAAPTEEQATTQEETAEAEDNKDAEETKEAAPEEPAATVGTPVELGDLSVTIDGVEAGVAKVGNDYVGAEAQGQFVIVSASILNNGDKAESFLTDSMKLIDDQGREHSFSAEAGIYVEGSWGLDQINPGNTLSGKFVFDIPADATPTKVHIENGLLGTDSVDIALN